MITRTYDITELGAKGDGIADDTPAFIAAISAAVLFNGSVYVPPGRYLVDPFISPHLSASVTITGPGSGVSVLVSRIGGTILDLTFLQRGLIQPFGLTVKGVGFAAVGPAAAPIKVMYVDDDGAPVRATNELSQPSTVFQDVRITSDENGWFTTGIAIWGAWGIQMTNVYVSGRPIGNWDALEGNGLSLQGMCVNSRFTNCVFNFWATGVDVRGNTEGLHFSNCSMVAVKRGVWVVGNGDSYPNRMSTLTWTGGLIELRVKGVTTGSAAFHLIRVHTALITGCQMITEAIVPQAGESYAFFLDSCVGVVAAACDINSFQQGVHTTGPCASINSHGHTFSNCAKQTEFNEGTFNSRSYGHTLFNNRALEVNLASPAAGNRIGFVN